MWYILYMTYDDTIWDVTWLDVTWPDLAWHDMCMIINDDNGKLTVMHYAGKPKPMNMETKNIA